MEYKLREWNTSDLSGLVEHANNYHVAKWLTDQFPHPYSEEDGKAFLELVSDNHASKIFAIEIEGQPVGSIGIFLQSDIHRKSAEIGYWLSEKYWGNNIMTEAIKEMVKYGFENYDIVRIFARPFSTNKASQKVLEKAGFKYEATLIKALYKNGEYLDEVIYAMLKD